MKKSGLIVVLGMALLFVSCRKHGCTDPTALNYSSVAKKDDGSCINDIQEVFMEEFSITFDPSTSYGVYYPNFHYEQGDLIVVEALSDDLGGGYQYWTPLPFVNNDVVFWSEYGEIDGDIWIYADYVSTGDPADFLATTTIGFRAALVKKHLIEGNPSIKEMSFDEIMAL